MNADVASLHDNPVAERVANVRKHEDLAEMSPTQLALTGGVSAMAWWKRWSGILEKPYVSGGEIPPSITLNGKCSGRYEGYGLGRSTDDACAAKGIGRERPRPANNSLIKVRQW